MVLVGDQERENAAVELRRHYVAGRLSEADLSERLEGVLQARSRRELQRALRSLPPRWAQPEELGGIALRVRHVLLVAVVATIWLMLSAAILVAFLGWVVANGVTLGGLIAFPLVWLALSALLYRRMALSRRRLRRP